MHQVCVLCVVQCICSSKLLAIYVSQSGKHFHERTSFRWCSWISKDSLHWKPSCTVTWYSAYILRTCTVLREAAPWLRLQSIARSYHSDPFDLGSWTLMGFQLAMSSGTSSEVEFLTRKVGCSSPTLTSTSKMADPLINCREIGSIYFMSACVLFVSSNQSYTHSYPSSICCFAAVMHKIPCHALLSTSFANMG